MYKTLTPLLLILTCIFSCSSQRASKLVVAHRPNHIDSIQNDQQIKDLIHQIDSDFRYDGINTNLDFEKKGCDKRAARKKVQPWTKADFDHNGLTDLLVLGSENYRYLFCIMDLDSVYKIIDLSRDNNYDCNFPVVRDDKIVYYFEEPPDYDKAEKHWQNYWEKIRHLEHITLVYKFGDFVEENPAPVHHDIQQLIFIMKGCWGPCPIFQMTIEQDGSVVLDVLEYFMFHDRDTMGTFDFSISPLSLDTLRDLLDYTDFPHLRDSFAVEWTDDVTSLLFINYDGGLTKNIYDYGMMGTFGLHRVYEYLLELLAREYWTSPPQ